MKIQPWQIGCIIFTIFGLPVEVYDHYTKSVADEVRSDCYEQEVLQSAAEQHRIFKSIVLTLPEGHPPVTNGSVKIYMESSQLKKELEAFIKRSIPENGWIKVDGLLIISEDGKLYGQPASIPTADGLSGYVFSREEIKSMKDFSALIKRRDNCIATVDENEKKNAHLTPEQKY